MYFMMYQLFKNVVKTSTLQVPQTKKYSMHKTTSLSSSFPFSSIESTRLPVSPLHQYQHPTSKRYNPCIHSASIKSINFLQQLNSDNGSSYHSQARNSGREGTVGKRRRETRHYATYVALEFTNTLQQTLRAKQYKSYLDDGAFSVVPPKAGSEGDVTDPPLGCDPVLLCLSCFNDVQRSQFSFSIS